MKTLKLLFIIIGLAIITNVNAQGDLPPIDDTNFDELDVPLSGSQIFFLIAIGIGGVFVFSATNKSRTKINESAEKLINENPKRLNLK